MRIIETQFRAKIKGDAGVYHVWAIDWLNQRMLVERHCGDEWIVFGRIQGLMQYTGLKDKNGQEMYEGDILRINEEPDDNCDSVVDIMNIGYLRGFIDRGRPVVIIGNIYENPELLKESSKC